MCLDVYQINDSLDLVELYVRGRITNSPPDPVSTTDADLDTLGMEGVEVLRRALLVLWPSRKFECAFVAVLCVGLSAPIKVYHLQIVRCYQSIWLTETAKHLVSVQVVRSSLPPVVVGLAFATHNVKLNAGQTIYSIGSDSTVEVPSDD